MILKEVPILEKSLGNDFIFDSESAELYENLIQKVVTYIQQFLSQQQFFKGENMTELNDIKAKAVIDSNASKDIDDVLGELNELYLQNTIAFHNPNYVAHLNCPVVLPAIIAELIAVTVNTAVETWDQSITATFIEQEVIRWICNEFNYPEVSDGVFTSGGTQSNFMALLMARDNYAFENFGINIKQNGWHSEVSKFRIFCSEKAHFSVKKNAALLGMGYDAVIPVKADVNMKMDTSELLLAIEKTKQEGNYPIAVVATLGTTDYGSFDPLEDIAKIANDYKMWLHVDGAYGGCYVLTDTHKHYFDHIEKADSITIDFHKTLFQPVCCSVFLAKNSDHFKYVSYYADYLNPIEAKDTSRPNLIEKSIQTTRRFDALKVWLTLKTLGAKTIASYLERVHYLAKEVYDNIVIDEHFEIAHVPELSTIVFRYKAEAITDNSIHDDINLFIKERLFKSGRASVASTKLNGNIFLKFTLLNPKNTIENLMNIITMIKDEGLSKSLKLKEVLQEL